MKDEKTESYKNSTIGEQEDKFFSELQDMFKNEEVNDKYDERTSNFDGRKF